MITPNKIKIEQDEITDEDIALDIKETKLNLQRARLKVGLPMELEDKPISKTEEPISEPLPEKATDELSEEKKQLLREIPF